MKYISIILALLVSGCVATGANFSSLVEPEEGHATFYFLREAAFQGSAYCPSLKLNGSRLGCLKNNGFIVAEAVIGPNFLKGGGGINISLTGKPNETIFLLYSQSGGVESSGVGMYSTYRATFYKISKERAMKILSNLKDSS